MPATVKPEQHQEQNMLEGNEAIHLTVDMMLSNLDSIQDD